MNVDHHEGVARGSGSIALGFETPKSAEKSKSDPNYWARRTSPRTADQENEFKDYSP